MALALLTAATLDRGFGTEVVIVASHDPSTVELNRALYTPGEAVAELYGNPLAQPVRVIMPRADRLLRPHEDPALLLLAVDKQKGENPLQAQTVWLFTKFAIAAFAVVGLVGFLVPRSW